MKIGIISPSNNFLSLFPNRCKAGIKNLNDIGIDVVFSSNAYRDNTCYKESIKERLEEFNEILDKDVDMIMSSVGGYNSIQLLDKIDYSKIKEKDAIFCGFSDITALLLAIYTKTKKEVLYGPVYTVNLCDYGGIDEYTKNSLLDAIEGKEVTLVPSSYEINEYIDWNELEEKEIIKKKENKSPDWKVIKEGEVTGKLIGGNLTTILLILGTEYLKADEFKDSILFLEDCDTNISEFCSYLDSLKIKGVLDKVKGIMIGKFNSEEMNSEIERFLTDYMRDYNIPVICNMDFGHVFPILTLPIGREATLKCTKDDAKIIVTIKILRIIFICFS